VAAATVEQLSAISGIGEKTADRILTAARGSARADKDGGNTDADGKADV